MLKKIVESCILAAIFISFAAVATSCDPTESEECPWPDSNSSHTAKAPSSRYGGEESRHVLLVYLAGFNTLSSYMDDDYEDLLSGYLPVDHHNRADNILLVYSQTCSRSGDYTEELKSHLIKLNSTAGGKVIADTLRTYGSDYISADSKTVRTVLEDVKCLFPAKSYGMVFSSHATGWVPAGYTTDYRTISKAPERSVGQTQTGTSGSYLCYEMDLKNFAKAFPMKFEYILFDACLMGCVEVAYELKDVCSLVGFSPAEVLADGYDYSTLSERLLKGSTPDPVAVVDDFFKHYESSQSSPFCTASVVDCSNMEPLVDVCSELFEKYRNRIKTLNPGSVQGYFRFGWHWYYDLEDIIRQAGASTEEMAKLRNALDQCVVYDKATPKFISFNIRTHCGMSMYLPSDGNAYLNTYYRDFAWNKATNLL